MRYAKDSLPGGFELPKDRVIVGSKVRLRGKKLSDARKDYTWQSDPELARLDAAPALSVAYPFYLLDYTDLLHAPGPNRFPLAVETLEGRHIGNCTYYDVDFDVAEAQFGIMIGDRDYWNRGYGTNAVNTLVNRIFQETKLNRLYLKTLDSNARAQTCFQKCGFKPYGRMTKDGHNFILMELHREQWQQNDNPI